MPADDLHPGVSPTTFEFVSPQVRAAIVAMAEMVAALTAAKDRGNHTGTQLAASISDFTAAVRLVTADTSNRGSVELATSAEVQTMTDTARAVTPSGLAAAAVSAATANRIVRRDSAGRAQVVAPSVAADIATKGYVDGASVNFGTTAQRDAYYGAYTTVAQQVAIANATPMWYNTTTHRFETFYAVAGSSGLTVPGLFSGWFSAGWYVAPESADWCGKSGNSSVVAAYKWGWARGIDTPGSPMSATADTAGIRIGIDGIYEISMRYRGSANGNAEYAALAFNGDRTTFEQLSGGMAAPNNQAIQGVWGHDHPAGNNIYGESSYLGFIPAGKLVTAGPATTGYSLPVSAAATAGFLTAKRIG